MGSGGISGNKAFALVPVNMGMLNKIWGNFLWKKLSVTTHTKSRDTCGQDPSPQIVLYDARQASKVIRIKPWYESGASGE